MEERKKDCNNKVPDIIIYQILHHISIPEVTYKYYMEVEEHTLMEKIIFLRDNNNNAGYGSCNPYFERYPMQLDQVDFGYSKIHVEWINENDVSCKGEIPYRILSNQIETAIIMGKYPGHKKGISKKSPLYYKKYNEAAKCVNSLIKLF